MACAILFVIFVFLYVLFQTDILALAQHVWSNGQTHFNTFIGASLFTIILWIIHFGVDKLFNIPDNVKTLTYFPSLLFLGVITSVSPDKDGNITVGHWWWISTLLLILFFLVCRMLVELRKIQKPAKRNDLLSRNAWGNYAVLAGLFLMTVGIGNTDRHLHESLRIERFIAEQEYGKTLDVLDNKPDSSTTMMRAFALNKMGKLGDLFFSYNNIGGADALIPQNDGSVSFSINNNETIWRYLGGIPRNDNNNNKINTIEFLNKLRRQGIAKHSVNDYMLTALLLERNLNAFKDELLSQYNDTLPVADSIPVHYREALAIYKHLHQTDMQDYNDNVKTTDYNDFLKILKRKDVNKTINECVIRDSYANTYWTYYHKIGITKN